MILRAIPLRSAWLRSFYLVAVLLTCAGSASAGRIVDGYCYGTDALALGAICNSWIRSSESGVMLNSLTAPMLSVPARYCTTTASQTTLGVRTWFAKINVTTGAPTDLTTSANYGYGIITAASLESCTPVVRLETDPAQGAALLTLFGLFLGVLALIFGLKKIIGLFNSNPRDI